MALLLTQTTGTPLAARSCRPGHHIPDPAMCIPPSSGTAARLMLMDVAGYTAAEAAQVLGCLRGTVLARVHRGWPRRWPRRG
jgi:hypothetical protein